MNVGTITQLTNHPPALPTEGAAFPCRAQSDCSPTDLEVSQRREKMWRDECTRIVNALADLAGLPRDPCPGWQPCIEKIKGMMPNVRPDAPSVSDVWYGRATELAHLARWADENGRHDDGRTLRAVMDGWATHAAHLRKQNASGQPRLAQTTKEDRL